MDEYAFFGPSKIQRTLLLFLFLVANEVLSGQFALFALTCE